MRKPAIVFVISLLAISILFLKQCDFNYIANFGFMLLSSMLFILNYRKEPSEFVLDLRKVLFFICSFSFVSYVAILTLPTIRTTWYQAWYAPYYTIGYVFFNQVPDDAVIFMRMSGVFWEAGCCCFAFNILLAIFIHQREKMGKISFAVLGVFLTYSTAGFVCLMLNFLYYIHLHKKDFIKAAAIISLLAIVAVPIISQNIEDKLKGDHSTSGIVRKRDLAIGAAMSIRYPLIGVDVEGLENNKEANVIEDAIWFANDRPQWTDSGYMLGGYTNGLFCVILNYGLILGLIFYYQIYKSPLINNWRINKFVVFGIFLLVLIGEPLSSTTLFMTLTFSNWILPRHVC